MTMPSKHWMLRSDQHHRQARSAAGGWGCPSISVPPIVLLPAPFRTSCGRARPVNTEPGGAVGTRVVEGGIYLSTVPVPDLGFHHLGRPRITSASCTFSRGVSWLPAMVELERKGSVSISPHSGWMGLRDRIKICTYYSRKMVKRSIFSGVGAAARTASRRRRSLLATRSQLGYHWDACWLPAGRRQIIAASASARVARIGDSHDEDALSRELCPGSVTVRSCDRGFARLLA
jgi:hypothetical protein